MVAPASPVAAASAAVPGRNPPSRPFLWSCANARSNPPLLRRTDLCVCPFPAALPPCRPGPLPGWPTLLGDVKPGKEPISLAVGDPSGAVPEFVKDVLAKSIASFGNYPAIIGTQDWRQAAGEWLNRRFALNGAIDPDKNLLPLNGTREGLFSVLFPLMPESKAGAAPHRGHAQSLLSMLCGGGAGVGRRAALCAGAQGKRIPAGLCGASRHDAGTDGGGLHLLALQSRRRGGR